MIDVLITYFLVYAVIGYVIEVIYCSLGERKLVNRGFLHGPWLPIYGIGALLVIVGTAPVATQIVAVFVVTVILTSAVEYIGSWALEKFFGIKLWDYSTYPLNIKGRVCAKNPTLFGLLGVALVFGLHPVVHSTVYAMSDPVRSNVAHAVILLLAVDTTASVMRLVTFTALLAHYQKRKGEVEVRLHTLAESVQNRLLAQRLGQEIDELHNELVDRARRLFAKFPSLTSSDEQRKSHLAGVRKTIKVRIKERREHDSK
ncbi:MAG: putative ABC transporter permease [Spirochaetales bacterium]|nr:putative ABC transporter permease [Spirochaetales bacterium]